MGRLFYFELITSQLLTIIFCVLAFTAYQEDSIYTAVLCMIPTFIIARCPIEMRNRQHRNLFFEDLKTVGVKIE